MQTMVEKLRLIADAIEQGKEIEVKNKDEYWKPSISLGDVYGDYTIFKSCEYRIKPDKPRVGNVIFSRTGQVLDQEKYQAVELTDEVHKALADAGIET